MGYYKFIDLNWKPVAEAMATYIKTKPELCGNRGAWVNCDLADVLDKIPDLQKMFNPLNIHIARVSLFVTNYKTGKIHIDDDTNAYRINFPILNCKDTETRYYKTISSPVKELQPNGVPYHFFNTKTCEQVDSFELDGVYVIKVHEPHQVIVNHKNFPRISCTIAFKENLENLFNSIT